jgi:hypothetical protein
MSMGGVFVAIDSGKAQKIFGDARALEQFIQEGAHDKPTDVLDIGDAWDVVRAMCEMAGDPLCDVVGCDVIEGTECNLCLSVPADRVKEIAPVLAEQAPMDIEFMLDAVDYEPLYHGESWRSDNPGMITIVQKIAGFYDRAAQRGDTVVFYVP